MMVLAVAVEEACRVDVVDVAAEAEVDAKQQYGTAAAALNSRQHHHSTAMITCIRKQKNKHT